MARTWLAASSSWHACSDHANGAARSEDHAAPRVREPMSRYAVSSTRMGRVATLPAASCPAP